MAKAKKKGAGYYIGGFFKWFFIVLGTLILVGGLTCIIMACYAANYINDVILPQVEDTQLDLVSADTSLSSSIFYYDPETDNYEVLQMLHAEENRVWATYEDIPEKLRDATVAIEDKRFWTHPGVDWRRTAGAVYYMFTGRSVQGGSTITQQLIKNVTQKDEVTVKRKILEIFEALEFDRTHSKEDTLEWYLNYIYLGRGCYGVKTAAKLYFDKELNELSLAECASLISTTNNPSLYDPYSRKKNNHTRAKTVITEMLDQGKISDSEAQRALDELGMVVDSVDPETGATTYRYDPESDQLVVYGSASRDEDGQSVDKVYTWYTDAVIDQVISDLQTTYGYDKKLATNLIYQGGLQIYSCLDPRVQAVVDEVYVDKSNFSSYTSTKGQDLMSAITIVDNNTGAVVAMSGGVGEKTSNRGWNCATNSKRPSGSSIKPLGVYAPAIEEGLITPYSAVDDVPFKERDNGKLWPVNSEGYYRGLTTIRTSMVESLNTSAVWTLDKLGLTTSYDYLTNRFGITSLVADDIDYAPLALGGQTYGVSTFEMAAAFATFPRGGVYNRPYLYSVVVDSNGKTVLTSGYNADVNADGEVTSVNGSADTTTILSEGTCYYITNMLRGVITDQGGTARIAAIPGVDVAGKTGTTTNDYDRWFCGYDADYTASVWVGYDRQERIHSSRNPATVLWQKVMSKLADQHQPEDMSYNVETVSCKYCTASGDLPSEACQLAGCVATGNFVKGDEPTSHCSIHDAIRVCAASGKIAGDKCLRSELIAVLDYNRTGAAAKADIQSNNRYLADIYAAGTCGGETLTYGAPVFHWSEDYSSCTAVFTSTNVELTTPDVQSVECSVESSRVEPSVFADGSVTYTAKVTFNGSSYSDRKSFTIPALVGGEPTEEETPTE